MDRPTRSAGSGLLASGARVTWTIADGARGRRWRSTLLVDSTLVGVLLLETGPQGAILKLELATAGGLLTLHPEGSTLHGNVVRPTGIEHVSLPWGGDRVLLVVGSPATAAAAARVLDARVGVGEGHTVAAVSVDVELRVEPATLRVLRPAERRWRFLLADRGTETTVALDEHWTPALDAGDTWPLELVPGS